MADLTQRLSIIVDALGGDKVSGVFKSITSSAEQTSSTVKDTGAAVAAAADRVAAAKMKEADAYGKLRVEEEKLKNLRDKGDASTAQIAAAEERVSSAQRRVQAATAETTRATEAQTKANREAVTSTDEVGESSSKTADKLREFGGEIAGLVAGFSLVDYLSESVTGFMDLARGASTLATSMNATTEQGGQLAAMFSSIGLESGDLLEIQAEFAGKVADSADGLTEVGTAVVKNADGTANWALTIQDALAELQQIPDATERNRAGFAMFGEEGYKQLSQLVNSSTDVADAFDKIGFPVDDADVQAVQDYDNAMLDLRLSSGQLGQSIGRVVVPALTAMADLGLTIAGAIEAVPGPILLTSAAAVALGVGMRFVTIEGGIFGAMLGGITTRVLAFASATGAAATGTGVMATAMGAARVAASGMLGLVGGPLGAALIAGGAAYYFAQEGADAFAESTKKAAGELSDSEGNLTKNRRELEAAARTLVEQAGYWEQTAMAVRGYDRAVEETEVPGWIEQTMDALGAGGLAGAFAEDEMAAYGAEAGIKDAADAVQGLAAQQEEAQTTTATLTDLIVAGDTSSRAFADAVREAAEAQAAEAATSGIAEAAIAAYTAATTGAFEATTNLFNAQLASEDAQYGFLEAMDAAKAATDDAATSVNEVDREYTNLRSAALDAGAAAGDAAVEAARAAGETVTAVGEANIRADAMLGDLRANLDKTTTERGRAEIQQLIDRLQEARDKGDVEAIVTLTGAQEAGAEIDTATEDRDTTVNIDSRGGPAVIEYLDNDVAGVERFALIRVESRNGPAVQEYISGLVTQPRLALIRVESRNGPAVETYIDGLERDRLALIYVESRGGPAVDQYLDNLANQSRTAVIGTRQGAAPAGLNRGAPAMVGAGMYGAGGTVNIQQLTVNTVTDSGGRLTPQAQAEAGRNYAAALDTWARKSGWRAP